jgi:uncharacterized membrane protein YjfL (UPF0719 family)
LQGVLELVGQTLAYAGIGLGILAAGFFLVDFLTPGHLGRQVTEEANPNAALLLASFLISLGLVEWFAIYFTGSGWGGLDDALVFGLVGLATQGIGFVILDLVTPGKLGAILMQQRFHPATAMAAAMQLAVALVVCASLT